MATRDNVPPPPDWTPTPKPWDPAKCCPPDCPGICETAQHAVFIHGEDWWMSDTFTLGSE